MQPQPIAFLLKGGPFVVTQGDLVVLTLQAWYNGNPVNLTGATFTTEINGPNGVGPVSFANSKHAITDAVNGFFTLTLQPTDTELLGLGQNKNIVTQIAIGGGAASYWGNSILAVLDVDPEP